MPKFLGGCYYNEEEISRHLKKKIEDIGRSKLMATSLQPVKSWKKSVEVVKGRILAGWAQKSPESWSRALSLVCEVGPEEAVEARRQQYVFLTVRASNYDHYF
jgi:hypothetical protein